MPDITSEQVHDLLTGTQEYLTSTERASQARDQLGHVLLEVFLVAKVGLRDLSAVSGLHHSKIRAMIQKAAGPSLPDGWDQPELPFCTDLPVSPAVPSAAKASSLVSLIPRTNPVIGL